EPDRAACLTSRRGDSNGSRGSITPTSSKTHQFDHSSTGSRSIRASVRCDTATGRLGTLSRVQASTVAKAVKWLVERKRTDLFSTTKNPTGYAERRRGQTLASQLLSRVPTSAGVEAGQKSQASRVGDDREVDSIDS